MTKSLEEKKKILAQITETMDNNKIAVLLKQEQLDGDEISEFRKSIIRNNHSTICVKNSLLAIYLKNKNITIPEVKGSMLLIAGNDILGLLNAVKKEIKTGKNLEFFCGVVNGEVLQSNFIETLSKFTNKQDMITQLVTLLKFKFIQMKDLLEKVKEKKSV